MEARWTKDIEAIARQCQEKMGSIALAESCTGGLLGGALTTLPGASSWFKGSVVAYHNDVKQRVLGVPSRVLETHGAVSEACALRMCSGTREALGSKLGLSITGIAGPGGATENKPLGLVFIALSNGTDKTCHEFVFSGDRKSVREQAVTEALALLKEWTSRF